MIASEQTIFIVEVHIARMMEKLQAESVPEFVRFVPRGSGSLSA